jgi:hypothetical protein
MHECQQCGQICFEAVLHKGVCYSCHEAKAQRVLDDANAGILQHNQRVMAIRSDDDDAFVTGDTGYVMQKATHQNEYIVDFGYTYGLVVVFAASFICEVVPLLPLHDIDFDERTGVFSLSRKTHSVARTKPTT